MWIILDPGSASLQAKLEEFGLPIHAYTAKGGLPPGHDPLLVFLTMPEKDRGKTHSAALQLLQRLEQTRKERLIRTFVLWQGSSFDSEEAEQVWIHYSTVVAYAQSGEIRDQDIQDALQQLQESPTAQGDFLTIGSALKMPEGDSAGPDNYGRHKFVSLFIGGMHDVLKEVRRAYRIQAEAYPPLPKHPFAAAADPQKLFESAVRTGGLPKEMDHECPGANLAPHVLIQGETGTGKTLLARWLHGLRQAPELTFQDLNCGAISEHLVAVELFGGKKGAYTGLDSHTPGKIWCAYRGTLFLDEIGELPSNLQTVLLKYLDDATYYPLHWHGPKLFVPTAVVAASNRDLGKMVQAGGFREDLYHRFRIQIRVPPLRERRQHFEQLVDFVLQNPRVVPLEGKERSLRGISLEALERLKNHDWPGNFRELEQVLWRASFHAREEQAPVILSRHILLNHIAMPR